MHGSPTELGRLLTFLNKARHELHFDGKGRQRVGDYLWELEHALDALSPDSGDQHISDLGERLRDIARREGEPVPDTEKTLVDEEGQGHEFRKVTSIDEQEEMEKAS